MCSLCDIEVQNDPAGADDDSQSWLCDCGAYIEDGMHCRNCGREPPWGCPCERCQDGGDPDTDWDEG